MTIEEIINQALAAYLECALWSSTDDEGTPLDEDYDVDDVSDETVAASARDLTDFIIADISDLTDMEPAQIGHDFWLTRNHHGAGFWDRGLGDRGERLTAAAHVYGSVDLYVGDDGKVHGS